MWSRRNHAPVLFLSINGEAANDILALTTSFVYEQNVGKAATTTWLLDNSDRSLPADPRLFSNVEWKYRYGYLDDLSPVITGVIRNVEPKYADDCTLTITLYDHSLSLSKGSAGRNWGNVSSSDIAKRLAAKYGLKARVDDSKDKSKRAFVQPGSVNDLQYLRDLAADLDFEVFVDGSPPELTFRKKDYDAQPERKLTFYTDPTEFSYVQSFSPRIESLGAVSSGVAKASTTTNDPKKADVTSGGTGLGGFASNYSVVVTPGGGSVVVPRLDPKRGVTSAAPSGADAKRAATAKRAQMLDRANEATSEHPLTPSIRMGTLYEWDGLDSVMNRKWYVKETKSTITGNQASTSVEWKRNASNKGAKKSDSANNKSADNNKGAGKSSVERKVFVNTATGSSVVQ